MSDMDVLWLDEHRVVSLTELVEISGLTREELVELVQGGAIPVREAQGAAYTFSAQVVTVARTACRLRDELELDMAGLTVAIRLLDRVRGLEAEIARLRALLPTDYLRD
jgi:chaperone modulatory protein CbpM